MRNFQHLMHGKLPLESLCTEAILTSKMFKFRGFSSGVKVKRLNKSKVQSKISGDKDEQKIAVLEKLGNSLNLTISVHKMTTLYNDNLIALYL